MTFQDRVGALSKFGFSPRQAGFLTTVMLHSGVFLGRQYCSYAGIVRGQKMHDFFSRLLSDQLATEYPYALGRTHVYHIHGKALYRAIGEPDNRHRKPLILSRAMERLMILDVVLAERKLVWLATEPEKVAYFLRLTGNHSDELPRLVFGDVPHQVVRYFPDKCPIGVDAGGQAHLFIYVVTRDLPIDFRPFLQRHAPLFGRLPAWTLRLVVPPHLAAAERVYRAVVREELTTPLRPSTRDELRWFFERRRNANGEGDDRFRRAQRAFASPRFRRLYRSWRTNGDAVLEGTTSPVLVDAFARRSAQIECHVLPHNYDRLSSLVGTS